MKRLLKIAILAACAPTLLACEPVLYSVEVEASEICVGNLSIPFGASQTTAVVEETLSDHDLGILFLDEFDPKISVRSVEIAPIAGVGDLEFIDKMMVGMSPDEQEATLPPIELVQLSSSDRLETGALYREPETAVDITTYVTAGEVVITLDLSGDVPDQPWLGSMDVCMSASAEYSETL